MGHFRVSDISCGHCEKAIKEALSGHGVDVTVSVDLQSKIIEVQNIPDELVVSLLEEIGYSPEKME